MSLHSLKGERCQKKLPDSSHPSEIAVTLVLSSESFASGASGPKVRLSRGKAGARFNLDLVLRQLRTCFCVYLYIGS